MSDATRVLRQPSPDAARQRFADDVEYYLSLRPRQLPSRYLYDGLGSALFDAICHLPWYRITRAERELLGRHGRRILALSDVESIVELGGGNGEKLVTLIEAAGAARTTPLKIHLVDVSASALALSSRVLSALDNVHIITHQAPYEDGLIEVAAARTRLGHRVLTLFLGSNIGNFDPPAAQAFLTQARASMQEGDTFLLGADLVKPERDLLLAYDDPLGVTAAFNRNLLERINRELGATFDLDGFGHRAIWNAGQSRIEMHLVSRRAQRARVGRLDLTFEAGETIWTESSYKYVGEAIVALLEGCGFRRLEQWIEPRAAFALTLAEAI